MRFSTLFFRKVRVVVFLLVMFGTIAPYLAHQVYGDPILAQFPFSNVNTSNGDNPQCSGNPPGTLCPGPGAGTIGTCFQPTVTGTLGSASLMLSLGQAPNGFPRRGQPVLTAQLVVLSPDPTTNYATTCRTSNPYSSSATILATSDLLSFCYSGAGCNCFGCVGLGQNLQVVTWAFTSSNQPILGASQTYVLVLWLFCGPGEIQCVYDDDNSVAQGVSSNAFAGGSVLCRACMITDKWNTGPFARSVYDSTSALGQSLSLPFVVYGTTGGVVTPPTSCQGGNCGTVTTTSSTTAVNFNSSLTLFYIGTSPFNGYIINATTYVGRTYIGTIFLGIYVVNVGCVTLNGPFSVNCPGILVASTTFSNTLGAVKLVFVTAVQISSGQTFAVAVSGSVNGLWINDTNTASPMFQTSGTLPTVINQYQSFSSTSHAALFAGLFQGTTPPSTSGAGGNTAGDELIGFVDWFGMGRLAGGLIVLLIFFTAISIAIGVATFHLGKSPGGQRRPGFPPVGFLLIFLFLVFIFSSPIGTGGVSILPPWITIFTMAVFAWLFTEGILRRGGRF